MARRRTDIHHRDPQGGRLRRARRLAIIALALVIVAASATPAAARRKTAFDGRGMWIWYLSQSSGGSPQAMAAQAHAHHVRTVFIKSGDGSTYWGQFSSALVSALNAHGLRVCAWQFVYGRHPKAEASVGASAIRAKANCLVIDAEASYEGRYRAARKYVKRLRRLAGKRYPIGLAGFPYVDYHPAFPYSVFLGPGGAQYNVPQVYWKAIGGGATHVLNHTYRWNRPYGRRIYPLGQLYDRPSRSSIVRFRRLAKAQGARGVSWWDWQEAAPSGWRAIDAVLDPWKGAPPPHAYATLALGARGDLVLWAQQHLRAAGQSVARDGKFGPKTEAAVDRFQLSAGLPVTGRIDTATWVKLLRYSTASKRTHAASASGSGVPATAHMRPRREEIPPPAKRH